jgi:hypothetical protein
MKATEEKLDDKLFQISEIIQHSTIVQEYIEKKYQSNPVRMHLLIEIFCGMGMIEQEELSVLIYAYGSMIGKEDLIERLVFLWLLNAAGITAVSKGESIAVR